MIFMNSTNWGSVYLFFSVLIPVYNTEKYLRQCVDSVLGQTEKDYEIILLDDGSTDGSDAICDEYAERYSNIRVIHKENEGLMMTRRRGFKEAKGDYFINLDSDDYLIDDHAFSQIKKKIESDNCDLVYYNYKTSYPEKDTFDDVTVLKYPDGYVFEGTKLNDLKRELCLGHRLQSMWIKAISRKIVDIETDYSIWKPAICRGEDIFQTFALIDAAQRVGYINKAFYCYRVNDANVSNNPKIKFYDAYRAIYTRFDEYMNKWDFDGAEIDMVHRSHIHHLSRLIITTRCFYKGEKYRTWNKYISGLKNDKFTKYMYKEAKRLNCKRNDRIIMYLASRGLYMPIAAISYYRTRNIIQPNAYY